MLCYADAHKQRTAVEQGSETNDGINKNEKKNMMKYFHFE